MTIIAWFEGQEPKYARPVLSSGLTLQEIAEKVVPKDVPWKIIKESDLNKHLGDFGVQQKLLEQKGLREDAYKTEADPLFFKWQAGEGTEEDWKAKREEIRQRYPYPTV